MVSYICITFYKFKIYKYLYQIHAEVIGALKSGLVNGNPYYFLKFFILEIYEDDSAFIILH
jgi:hypothetical protein